MHDREQLALLLDRGKLPGCFQPFLRRLTKVHTRYASKRPDQLFFLAEKDFEEVGDFFCLPLSGGGGGGGGGGDSDGSRGLVVIDNLLSPQALAALVTWAEEATVWTDIKRGYLGAHILADGLLDDLFVGLIAELRQAFPRVIGQLEIVDLWAYKYAEGDGDGIGIHADDALVNLNWWVAPDDAAAAVEEGEGPGPAIGGGGGGGMTVFHSHAPEDADIARDFNSPAIDLRGIEQQGGGHRQGQGAVSIPYRQNRAVLFTSTRLHRTEPYHFRKGYRNRRINFTALFGRRRPRREQGGKY
eukprot:g1603.t1